MKNVRMKYILSALLLLSVTALVVIAPYGYNYINDSIKEGQTYNDGTFSYSAGKSDLTYDEVRLLLKSDPVWINETPATVDADIFKEFYSALNSFYSAMEGNDDLKEVIGYPLSAGNVDNMEVSYCALSKVSGVVDDVPMTVNLMTVDLYAGADSQINDIIFMYNRDNLKVYEYICNFNIDNDEVYSVYEEVPIDSDVETFVDNRFAEYLDTTTKNYSGDVYYNVISSSICAFGVAYNYNSLSYGKEGIIDQNFDSYQ